MSPDWFDPLGLRRIADSVSTMAARSLVGRSIDISDRHLRATISDVNEASPATDVEAVVAGQVGLWRVFDADFSPVTLASGDLETVNVRATSVRMIDALSPRLTVKTIDIVAVATPSQTAAWIETATAAPPRFVDGQMLGDIRGLGRFGQAVLDPWVEGRTIGFDARSVLVRGRVISLPERFQRRFEREIEWLPPRTVLESISFDEAGGVTIEASITDYEVPLDARKLLADLSSRGPSRAVRVLLGPAS